MPSLLSEQFDAEIRAVVAAEYARQKTAGRTLPTFHSTPRIVPLAVILNETLGAGTILNPTSAMATLCEWDVDSEEYTQLDSESDVEVWNHSSRSHDEDTPGLALPCDGHLWFLGDCQAWADRPAPPGGA